MAINVVIDGQKDGQDSNKRVLRKLGKQGIVLGELGLEDSWCV